MTSAALRLLLLCCLLAPAWAAPRIAIITPLDGQPILAGKSLTTPAFAEEGQLLDLPAGSQVRVQLLASNRQTHLKGPRQVTLSKEQLNKIARGVTRDKLSVAQEAGNLQRSAAATTRATDPLGWSLVLPGKATEQGWEFPVKIDPKYFKSNQEITVTLGELQDSGQSWVFDGSVPNAATPGLTLLPGHRYLLMVQGVSLQYKRVFQVLTPEEKSHLRNLENQLLSRRPTVKELLRVADLYDDFDQTEEVARLLEQVVAHPQFEKLSQEEREQVRGALNRALDSLDLPIPKASPN